MSHSKRIIHLSRAISVHVDGSNEAVDLVRGRNEVDHEVAEHGFVKAHMTDPADVQLSASAAELESARLRIADLEKQLAEVPANADFVNEQFKHIEELKAEIIKRDEAGATLADMLEKSNKENEELKGINKALSMTGEKTPKK
jgi:hypothetical protein